MSACWLIDIILLTLIITSSNDVLKESVLGSHESPPPTWHCAGRLRTFFQSQKCHPLPPYPHSDNTQAPHSQARLPLTCNTGSSESRHEMLISEDQNWTDWCFSVSLDVPLRSRKSLQSRLCRTPSLKEHIDTGLKISNIKTKSGGYHVIPHPL